MWFQRGDDPVRPAELPAEGEEGTQVLEKLPGCLDEEFGCGACAGPVVAH
jgi:hypothetical protein